MSWHGLPPLVTQVQRVFQVGAIKKILQERMSGDQKVTPKVLKNHFDQNLEIKSGEAMTEHFLTTALALWKALFSVQSLKDPIEFLITNHHRLAIFGHLCSVCVKVIEVLMLNMFSSFVISSCLLQEIAFLMDETFGKRSPIDSVVKLESVMRSCRSSCETQKWVLLTMADLCLNRVVSPKEMTLEALFGKSGQKGNLGCSCNKSMRHACQ